MTSGRNDLPLAQLAEEEGLDVRFLEHIRSVLSQAETTFPTSAIVEAWRALPAPSANDAGAGALQKVRSECGNIYKTMREWQSLLAATTGDDEEAAVLTGESIKISPRHSFTAEVQWPKGAKTARLDISVAPANANKSADSMVIWRNARIRFRGDDKRWTKEQLLKVVLDEKTVGKLKLGRHPRGGEIRANDFVIPAATTVVVDFEVPDSTTDAEIRVDVGLDLEQNENAVVRCSIADGEVEGETAAETGAASVLLGNPKSDGFAAWKAGALEFARNLPAVSHREPAPSDRDPIPAPFDNTYNSTERNLFHYRIKYHRDDQFLVNNILDDTTRKRLDHAWSDLLSSFEYHDAYLGFVAKKFGLDLQDRTVAELDQVQIERLPPELRGFVQPLRDGFLSTRRAVEAAEPGHIEDAIRIAHLAWRRPLLEEAETRLHSFYAAMRSDSGLDHTEAIRALLARILVAPEFLFRAEKPPDKPGATPLSGWELANRLSYFLWSSMPDEELRQAAASGELQDPENLANQARRMLRDPKAKRLAAEFFGQWFGFYRFEYYRGVDPQRFPEFTEAIKAGMYEEALSFFGYTSRRYIFGISFPVRYTCLSSAVFFSDDHT